MELSQDQRARIRVAFQETLNSVDYLIACIPTSEMRNLVTEANIKLMQAKSLLY